MQSLINLNISTGTAFKEREQFHFGRHLTCGMTVCFWKTFSGVSHWTCVPIRARTHPSIIYYMYTYIYKSKGIIWRSKYIEPFWLQLLLCLTFWVATCFLGTHWVVHDLMQYSLNNSQRRMPNIELELLEWLLGHKRWKLKGVSLPKSQRCWLNHLPEQRCGCTWNRDCNCDQTSCRTSKLPWSKYEFSTPVSTMSSTWLSMWIKKQKVKLKRFAALGQQHGG